MSLTDERPTITYLPPSGRRAERRLDEDAEARRKREDADAAAERDENAKDAAAARKAKADRDAAELAQQKADREADRKAKARAEKIKAKAKARKDRAAKITAFRAALAHHMPVVGLPVVAVSLILGWSGQAEAAAALGMGWASFGMPVITEGATLTFAGLTAAAIDHKRPHKGLLYWTWSMAIFAAGLNAAGHMIGHVNAAGMYRAGGYAFASLLGVGLWAVVMRQRRRAVSKHTADELARWRRISRRHPILYRRAVRAADITGADLATAWPIVWERAQGAAPGEPSIREIRAARRAAYLRTRAESWDGRRRFERKVPVTVTAAPPAEAEIPIPVLLQNGKLRVYGPTPAVADEKPAKTPTTRVGKGLRRSGKTPERPLEEADLVAVRMLAEGLGGTDMLSTANIRKRVGCRTDYAIRLRDTVRSEEKK